MNQLGGLAEKMPHTTLSWLMGVGIAAGVAHDFNGLLTVINAYVELALGDFPPTARWTGLGEVAKAGRRATELCRQLLVFGQPQPATRRRVDVNRAIGELQGMFALLLREDVVLELDLDPHLDAVGLEPGNLEQVLVNLVANAQDAMPRGGTLGVQTREVTCGRPGGSGPNGLPPGRYVVLEVRDTGEGMDAQTAARVFEPFFTTKARGEGTGLGLATVYSLVCGSGGDVEVRAPRGEGTTVSVYLPRVGPAAAVRAPAVRPAPGWAATRRCWWWRMRPRCGTSCSASWRGRATRCTAVDGAQALDVFDARGAAIDLLLTERDHAGHERPGAGPGSRSGFPACRCCSCPGTPTTCWSDTASPKGTRPTSSPSRLPPESWCNGCGAPWRRRQRARRHERSRVLHPGRPEGPGPAGGAAGVSPGATWPWSWPASAAPRGARARWPGGCSPTRRQPAP